ncbi:XrtN system VIT domain-containing protein [Flavobacterium sp.]
MESVGIVFKNYLKKEGVSLSIIATVLSASFLIIALVASKNEFRNFEAICFLSVIIEFIYGIVLGFNLLKRRERYAHLLPFLYTNWFIGCFCANVFINVFENLPIWVYVATFLFCLSCFVMYNKSYSQTLTRIAYMINGVTIMLIIYYALFLIPLSFFSVIGILALGIGFYGLVPAIVLLLHAVTLAKLVPGNKKNLAFMVSGVFSVVIGLIIFTVMLKLETNSMRANFVTKSFEKTDDDLPSYILISQNLKPNFFNEILLKKGLVYTATENFFELRSLNSFGQKQYNERKVHNPFYNIAYLFTDDLEISADDQINILKSNFDKRLETEEQLWSGEDLFTKNIKEDVKLFPKERLAYTEITMDIACKEESWRDQEAIYSFQLPVGSVATSLSLWVNGVERKGVLTTKEKAQAAYKQIVGVEARDPSLMQWKEGNRVVVRVFPISYKLPRTFKCGFTTPLKANGNELTYNSIQIKGPSIFNAETLSRIQVSGDTKFKSTKDFDLTDKFYTNQSKGLDQWQATLPIGNLDFSHPFIWKDKAYQIQPLVKQREPFIPTEIILDLNSSWTKEEIREIVSIPSKKFYVLAMDSKEEINGENYETVFSRYENLQYSLPQLFKIADSSLVITKCGNFSANFEELEESGYLKKLRGKTKNKKVRVINIGGEMNPFWQTVKEQHYVQYATLSLADCRKSIKENTFISLKTADNRINIEAAGISINENPASVKTKNNGINHIYRMYAFGKVLSEHVAQSEDSLANNQYIYLAKDANIVTPVSSLIVLETDADYEKQGIEKNVNTLGNASINNDGAVPEPHEWLMILLGLGAIAFYYNKQKNKVA